MEKKRLRCVVGGDTDLRNIRVENIITDFTEKKIGLEYVYELPEVILWDGRRDERWMTPEGNEYGRVLLETIDEDGDVVDHRLIGFYED